MRDLEKQSYDNYDVVLVKALYKCPVPTAEEFRMLLDRIPDYHPHKIAIGLMGIEALRPSEVVGLTWNNFFMNEDQTCIRKIRHMVYKPRNRITHISRRLFYKEIEKPMFSKWLSNQILGYRERWPEYPYNKVFPWTTADALGKFFSQARKKWGEEMPFLLDQNTWPIKGQDKSRYRVHPYSFRRFAFTFHYYNTFNKDIVTLSRAFGHSRTETTFDYYIFSHDAIGLNQEEVTRRIDIDTLLKFKPHDMKLTEFCTGIRRQVHALRAPGQRQLQDFAIP